MKDSSIKIHPLPQSDQPTQKEEGQLSLDIIRDKENKRIVILAPIAGVDKSDVTISVTDDVLIIKGERKEEHEYQEEDYYTKECFWGRFSRSIILPLDADTKSIKASFDKNILRIEVPIQDEERTKVIKIKDNDN